MCEMMRQLEEKLHMAVAHYREGAANGDFPTFWEGQISGLKFAIDILSAHQATQVQKPAITPPHLYPMCTCDLQSPYRGAQHGEDCPLWKGGE